MKQRRQFSVHFDNDLHGIRLDTHYAEKLIKSKTDFGTHSGKIRKFHVTYLYFDTNGTQEIVINPCHPMQNKDEICGAEQWWCFVSLVVSKVFQENLR